MAYGVTADGFVIKPIEVILEEIEDSQKATFGAAWDVSATSPEGQINASMADQFNELWQLAQAVYAAHDPDQTSGVPLAALSALTGTVVRGATKSTVTGQVNLDAGVTLPAGQVASVDGSPDSRFVTLAAVTNSLGVAADVDVSMEAESTGPVAAYSGTLTVINTPFPGWNSVTNVLDATPGETVESDSDLRQRREDELRKGGAASKDAIRADVLDVDGVETVTVYQNTTDTVDGEGLPAKSVEVLVYGGADDDVAQAIWDSVAGGIEIHGDDSGTAVDDDGNNQTVPFTRPDEIAIGMDITVTTNDDYPADGDDQIKVALVTWALSAWASGDDVIWAKLFPLIFSVSGVTDVPTLEIGKSGLILSASNYAIGAREIATLSTGNIAVTS